MAEDIESQHRICELRLQLLKDEIAAQANTFDQIDSKTGVALGFTFVVVGQVLASVFRIATDQSHLQSRHLCVTQVVFGLANGFTFLAVACGVVSRWPRTFANALVFTDEELAGDRLTLLQATLKGLGEVTVANDKTNRIKGAWARWTYLLVGAALVSYLALTVLLYVYAIPKP
jgi:hypothetical protein